jgi:hypothetical protein
MILVSDKYPHDFDDGGMRHCSGGRNVFSEGMNIQFSGVSSELYRSGRWWWSLTCSLIPWRGKIGSVCRGSEELRNVTRLVIQRPLYLNNSVGCAQQLGVGAKVTGRKWRAGTHFGNSRRLACSFARVYIYPQGSRRIVE